MTFSPDGNYIYFIQNESAKSAIDDLYRVETLGGGIPKELDFKPDVWRWTANSRELIYADDSAGYSNLFELSLENEKSKPIIDFKTGRIFDFDISQNYKDAVFLRGTFNSDVIMLEKLH